MGLRDFWKRKDDAASTASTSSQLEAAGTVEEEYEYKQVRYKDFITKPKYLPWWILLVVLCVITALLTIYHEQIIDWLTPVSQKIRALSWGWIIPILVLFVISFPPLFGHEIVAILCGAIYGLWIGFGIVAAGTFFGEIGTYYVFKYILRKRAIKLEKTNLNYGALARITRDGGFFIVFLIRLSVIPSHFSTAVFATCGVRFWIFLVATFVTLPKQLVVVYLGVLIASKNKGKTVSNIVLGITFLITVFAAVYIFVKMRRIRQTLLDEQAERRRDKQQLLHPNTNSSGQYASFQQTHGVASSDDLAAAPHQEAYEMHSTNFNQPRGYPPQYETEYRPYGKI